MTVPPFLGRKLRGPHREPFLVPEHVTQAFLLTSESERIRLHARLTGARASLTLVPRVIAARHHLATSCPDLYGNRPPIVTTSGKMGYGSYMQLVIYSQQLLAGCNWGNKRNGGACRPRLLPPALRGD